MDQLKAYGNSGWMFSTIHHSPFLLHVASVVTWGRRDLARQLRFKSRLIWSNIEVSRVLAFRLEHRQISWRKRNSIYGIFEWIHLAQDIIFIRWIYEMIEIYDPFKKDWKFFLWFFSNLIRKFVEERRKMN